MGKEVLMSVQGQTRRFNPLAVISDLPPNNGHRQDLLAAFLRRRLWHYGGRRRIARVRYRRAQSCNVLCRINRRNARNWHRSRAGEPADVERRPCARTTDAGWDGLGSDIDSAPSGLRY